MTATDTSWFATTPEAVLRAESILLAFHEDRLEDIGTILALDYGPDAEPGSAVHVVVALITMADRLADYGSNTTEHAHRALLRETARVVAEAVYNTKGTP